MPQPYDRIFKLLAEDDPRGLLHIAGVLPLDAPLELEPLPRELALETRVADTLFRVRGAGREHLLHFEVQAQHPSVLPRRLAKYAIADALKYELPLEMVLLLLSERHAPATVPTSHTWTLGGLKVTLDYRVVKLWELDAAAVLALNRPRLLPWIAAMRATWETLREAARRIVSRRDRKLASEFLTLGGLRYDNSRLLSLLEEESMPLSVEDLQESSFIQWVMAESQKKYETIGRMQGEAQGREQGRVEATKQAIRKLLAARFSTVAVPDALNAASADVLEAVFDRLVLVQTPADAQAALDEHLGGEAPLH